MSVCFFVSSDQAGTSTATEETLENDQVADDTVAVDSSQLNLQQFWAKVMDDIKKVTADHFKTQALPLARIKKIMKLDEEVKMISMEAPVLFAKAAEIFIHELTMRAWSHTEDNKRRTLQRNDIAMAISKSDQFDFLIDIVPRHEVKPTKPREEPVKSSPPTDQYYLQLAQQQAAALQNTAQPLVLQPCAQLLQTSGANAANTTSNVAVSPPQQATLVQQLVTPAGDVPQVAIQLTQAQLNMIRMQVQNNPNQPIVIQTQPQQTPQIIQVTSLAQQAQQPQQQMYIAQVASED